MKEWKQMSEPKIIELAKEKKTSTGQQARDYLCQHHYSNIVAAARKFYHEHKCYSFELKDIINEGIIGFLQAIERYDASKGTSLKTYAYFYIFKAMQDAFLKNDSTVRKPLFRNKKATNKKPYLTQKNIFSLENISPNNIPSREPYCTQLDNIVEAKDVSEKIEKLLKKLNPLQETLIRKKYGIGCLPETISKIQQELHINSKQFRQQHQAALKYMETTTLYENMIAV